MNPPPGASYAELHARAQDLSLRIAELARPDSDNPAAERGLRLAVYVFLFTTRN